MMHLVLALAPQIANGISACEVNEHWTRRREVPLAQLVSLELSTDRREYVVGEAIHFTVTLTNRSTSALDGMFRGISPMSGMVRIDSQADGRAVKALDAGTIDPHLRFGARGRLEPEAAITGSKLRAVDRASGALLLDQPGKYTFKATFCEANGDLNSLVVSNDTVVEARPVPQDQLEAWRAYTSGVAGIGEGFSFVGRTDPDAVNRAYEFVEAFPDSLWSSDVRRRLLGFMPRPGADQAQKDRYERNREATRSRGEKRFNGRDP